MRRSPILLKPAVLFVNFQKGNEIHNQFLVTLAVIVSLKKIGPIILLREKHTTLRLLRSVTVSHGRYADFQRLHILLFGY
jgi:hypothetical protein